MTVELTPYELRLVSPMVTSYRSIESRHGVLVSIDDAGSVGWGDACPMEGWSSSSIDDVVHHLAAAAKRVDPDGVGDALDMLEGVPEAQAALSGAFHDLSARRARVPLASLLAPTAIDRVRVNASIGAAATDRAVRDASQAVSAGFSALKLKVGAASPDDDVARVGAIRHAVGDDVEIRLDANGAWDVDTAIAVLDRLAESDVAFCEEPTAGIDAIATVGSRSVVPVAVDESARTIDDIIEALGTGSIQIVVVKPQALGGPDLAMQAVDLVHAAQATVVVTSMIDSAIGVAHAVHVAAAVGTEVAHGLATSPLLVDDVARALPIVDGHVLVPTQPGIGVSPV